MRGTCKGFAEFVQDSEIQNLAVPPDQAQASSRLEFITVTGE